MTEITAMNQIASLVTAVELSGATMLLRIHWRDVEEDGKTVGVQYHYEIVIGLGGSDPISRFLNRKITAHFSPEFFETWHLHNTVEVGTFENFLPALYDQRGKTDDLRYFRDMNSIGQNEPPQAGFDQDLFEQRVRGYKDARDAHRFQAWAQPSILATSLKDEQGGPSNSPSHRA